MKRGGRARRHDADIGPAPASQLLDRLTNLLTPIDHYIGAELLREVAARPEQVDADHPCAGAAGELGDDLADDAQAEDGDGFADVDLRIQRAVQRDRADLREDTQHWIGLRRQNARPRIVGADDVLGAMTPGAEHALTDAQRAACTTDNRPLSAYITS